MEYLNNKSKDGQKDESSLVGWHALWFRFLEDMLTIPFFLFWSVPICFAIQFSSDKNINDFFVNTHGEGIALKSIVALFAVSIAPTGLALLVGPYPTSKLALFLRSPARSGRAMAITTLAFIMGAGPALWKAEGLCEMWSLLALPIFGVLAVWLILFTLETLIVNANFWKSVKKSEFAKILGVILLVIGIATPAILYTQIKGGAYYTGEKKQKPLPNANDDTKCTHADRAL